MNVLMRIEFLCSGGKVCCIIWYWECMVRKGFRLLGSYRYFIE